MIVTCGCSGTPSGVRQIRRTAIRVVCSKANGGGTDWQPVSNTAAAKEMTATTSEVVAAAARMGAGLAAGFGRGRMSGSVN